MSGLQGERCHFDNAMILLMNFERPTTCQYDMPHVVAYVVLVRVSMSAFAGCRHSAVHALVGSGQIRTHAVQRAAIGSLLALTTQSAAAQSAEGSSMAGIHRQNRRCAIKRLGPGTNPARRLRDERLA
jgi:hypothetical protein